MQAIYRRVRILWFGFKQQLTAMLYIEMGMMRNGYARDDSILIYTI